MGASMDYLPDDAKGEKVTGADLALSGILTANEFDSNEKGSSSGKKRRKNKRTTEGQPSLEQKEAEIAARLAYEKCASFILGRVLSSCQLLSQPEERISVDKKVSKLVLDITPVLVIVPVKKTISEKELTEAFKTGTSLLKVESLYFEISRGNDAFQVSRTTTLPTEPTTEGRSESDRQKEDFVRIIDDASNDEDDEDVEIIRNYACPTRIAVAHTISSLPFPLTVRLANVMFSKEEVDRKIKRQLEKIKEFNRWRASHPLSSGNVLPTACQTWEGDKYANRAHSSSNFAIESAIEEDIDCGDDKYGRGNNAYISTSYRCSKGSYFSDLEQCSNFRTDVEETATKAISSGPTVKSDHIERRDMVLLVDELKCNSGGALGPLICPEESSTGPTRNYPDTLQRRSEARVIYQSKVSPKNILHYYSVRWGDLSSRLISANGILGTYADDGIREMVDPEVKEYNGTEPHLRALRNLMFLIENNEFYFGRDFMFSTYLQMEKDAIAAKSLQDLAANEDRDAVTFVKKEDGGSLVKDSTNRGSVARRSVSKIGCYRDGKLTVSVFNQNRTFSNEVDEIPSELASELGGDADQENVYSVPKRSCDRIRRYIYNEVHQKMLFSDFSDPKVEVNADPQAVQQFLASQEIKVNQCLWGKLRRKREKRILKGKAVEEEEKKAEEDGGKTKDEDSGENTIESTTEVEKKDGEPEPPIRMKPLILTKREEALKPVTIILDMEYMEMRDTCA
jgi:hypothetical protein